MLNIDKMKVEALFFRQLLDQCDKHTTQLVTENFPVNNCKLSSMLFIYHLFILCPDAEIFGVSGIAKDNKGKETITHHWIEYGDMAIDLTADQYNDMDRIYLSENITQERPYESVYVGSKGDTLQYKLFRIVCRDKYDADFSSVGEDFIEDMKTGYSQMMKSARYTYQGA